ncbi:hypothetical protein LUZ60_004826 [Juncus effusus]|nr:hypothetical protein LUZ60_004826 [Juncus effusus]
MAMKTKQELAREAQTHLEETINAAYLILSSMNDELCDAALWPPSSSSSSAAVAGGANIPNNHLPAPTHVAVSSEPSDSNHLSEFAGAGVGGTGGSLDEARHRYKSSMAALRASINAIFAFSSEENGKFESESEQSQIDRVLEAQATSLRKEIETKNKHVKLLIDQLRNLIADISMWQSPCSL